MKVCILTEGGKNAGLGHITRCISIYQAFEKIGIRPELIVNGDETVHDFVKGRNCKIFDWLNERESLFALVRDADIVFVDSYLADYDLYEKISDIAGTGVYFDDNIRMEYPRGFVINGAILAERMPYLAKKDVIYLLGTKYTPLRKEFWDVPVRTTCDNVEVIMITFGGEDIGYLTPKVLEFLNENYSKFVKNVIIGSAFQNAKEIDDLKDKKTNLIYSPDAEKMKRIMIESDLAISAGGQTLYELLRTGTPTIGICIVDNQEMGMKNCKRVGCLEYLGWYDQKHLLDRLKRAISKLLVVNERRKRSRIGRKYLDGKGPSRVIDFLLKLNN